MKSTNEILEPPRMAGMPSICLYENRPAYESKKAFEADKALHFPSVTIYRIWQCHRCKMIHAQGGDIPPSGASSGSSRNYVPPKTQAELHGFTLEPA